MKGFILTIAILLGLAILAIIGLSVAAAWEEREEDDDDEG